MSVSGLGERTTAANPAAPASETASERPTNPPDAPAPTQTRTTVPPPTTPPTQTRTQTQTQTRTQVQVTTQTAAQTQQVTATPTPTPTPARTSAAAAASGSSDSSTPAWVWWVIGLVVVAGVATTAVLVHRRRRKRAWADKLTASVGEVAWFARDLIPRLAQAPTAQQMAGGWRIESGRVVTIEDRLTALEAGAVDDAGRRQARALRDTVRASRMRLGTLDTAHDPATALDTLRITATDLENALTTADPSTQLTSPHQ